MAANPSAFRRSVEQIRSCFLHDPGLRVTLTELARLSALPASVCAPAVAALVNEQFLAWRDETLARADVAANRPRRRTA